jgi:hypothetical protein
MPLFDASRHPITLSGAWFQAHFERIQGYLQHFPSPEAFDTMLEALDNTLPKDPSTYVGPQNLHQNLHIWDAQEAKEELLLEKLFQHQATKPPNI